MLDEVRLAGQPLPVDDRVGHRLVEDDEAEVLTDELVGRPAEELDDSIGDEREPAVRVRPPDHVRRRLHDLPEARLRLLELALEALAVRHVPGDPVDADELPVVEVADDVDLERDLAPVGVAERDARVLDLVGCRDQRRVARRGERQGVLGNVVGERAPDRLPERPNRGSTSAASLTNV